MLNLMVPQSAGNLDDPLVGIKINWFFKMPPKLDGNHNRYRFTMRSDQFSFFFLLIPFSPSGGRISGGRKREAF